MYVESGVISWGRSLHCKAVAEWLGVKLLPVGFGQNVESFEFPAALFVFFSDLFSSARVHMETPYGEVRRKRLARFQAFFQA